VKTWFNNRRQNGKAKSECKKMKEAQESGEGTLPVNDDSNFGAHPQQQHQVYKKIII